MTTQFKGLKGPGQQETVDGSALRIGIVHSRWNTELINPLVEGARKKILGAGVKEENIIMQSVPGSYELPFAASRLYAASQVQSSSSSTTAGGLLSSATDLLSQSTTDLTSPSTSSPTNSASTAPFDAIIAIGVLIKGDTKHDEFIADAVAHGLMRVQLDTGVPVIFGLLTVLNEEQGRIRAGVGGEDKKSGHNHGEDWGSAAVELGVKRRGWAEGKFH